MCRRSGQVDLVAYVEPLEANRKAAQEQFQIPDGQVFQRLEEALAAVDAEFVAHYLPAGSTVWGKVYVVTEEGHEKGSNCG